MNISKKIFISLIITIFLQAQPFVTKFAQPQKMIVCVLVADIKNNPHETLSNYKKQDNFRVSQALFGEHILGLESEQDWIKAEFLEQKTADSHNSKNVHWNNIVGWIKKDQVKTVTEFPVYNIVTKSKWTTVYSDAAKQNKLLQLPIGIKLLAEKIDLNWWKTYLIDGSIGIIETKDVCELDLNNIENIQNLRKNIIETAKLFLADPYLWKGRSCYDKDLKTPLTSIDCAGLINLIYRANGLEIPRNPECQYLKAKAISINQLQEGDVIFWATSLNPNKIVHAMMYVGNNKIIESPRVNTQVRECSFEERVQYHIKIGRIVSYFGSFLNSSQLIKNLRIAAITDNYTCTEKEPSSNSTKQSPKTRSLDFENPRRLINPKTKKFSN